MQELRTLYMLTHVMKQDPGLHSYVGGHVLRCIGFAIQLQTPDARTAACTYGIAAQEKAFWMLMLDGLAHLAARLLGKAAASAFGTPLRASKNCAAPVSATRASAMLKAFRLLCNKAVS